MVTADLMGERLVLRCLDESDATPRYLGWLNDPEVNRYLESRFNESTLPELREFIRANRESSDQYLFGIFTRAGNLHVGNIKLGPISTRHSHAAIGLIIGEKSAWGRGFATEAIGIVTDWAFSDLGISKLFAGSYSVNKGSIAAFQRNGYSIEGTQANHVELERGVRDDVVLLGLWRT